MPDPVETNPDLYHVVLENDRVRVLEYLDHPGDATTPHSHPDSVMITVSSFRRRLSAGGRERAHRPRVIAERDAPRQIERAVKRRR